jgi:hypothetical protein
MNQAKQAAVAAIKAIKGINTEIAWSAAHRMVVIIGMIALFSFIATLHPFFMVVALMFFFVMWYLLYRIELAYRTRRFNEFRY